MLGPTSDRFRTNLRGNMRPTILVRRCHARGKYAREKYAREKQAKIRRSNDPYQAPEAEVDGEGCGGATD